MITRGCLYDRGWWERRAHIWPRLNEWLTNLAFPVSLHASTFKDNDKEIKKKRLIVNNDFC